MSNWLDFGNIAEVEQDQQILTGRFKKQPAIPKATQSVVAMGIEPAELDAIGESESKRDFEAETEDSDSATTDETDPEQAPNSPSDAKPAEFVDVKPADVNPVVVKPAAARPKEHNSKAGTAKSGVPKSGDLKHSSTVILAAANADVPRT